MTNVITSSLKLRRGPFICWCWLKLRSWPPVVGGTHRLYPMVPHEGQGFLNGDICSFKSHTGSLGLKKAAMSVGWLLVSTKHRSSHGRVKEQLLTTFTTPAEALEEKKKESVVTTDTKTERRLFRNKKKSLWQIVSSSVNDIFIFSCSKATPKDLESQYLTERVCSLEVIFSGST